LEVLALLVHGCTDMQIAAALHISPKAAGASRVAILDRLGVGQIVARLPVSPATGAAPASERRDASRKP
jgi:DNA-binding NarL/FixJ family response regulator